MRLVTSLTSAKTRPSFVKEVEKLHGGEEILNCIQCGLCAGSCPTRYSMDYSPTQIIKMIHLGMREEVLSSSAIWTCSTCYTCASRCPRTVDITALMMSLRTLSLQEKFEDKNTVEAKFHRSFFEIIRKYGRLHEPSLLTSIIDKRNVGKLLHNIAFGLRLWRKGKLQLRPQRIEQSASLREIIERTSEEASR